MNLSTNYLGLTLRTPLVPSASPLTASVDNIRRMEDAGASAVVLHSLFEEQIQLERAFTESHLTQGTESYAESLTYFPEWPKFRLGPDEYLKLIRDAKAAVGIPIIASLNCTSLGSWTDYAKDMADAGADALELNIYSIPTDFDLASAEIEQNYIAILRAVKAIVTIPVAVKLGPFFTNFGRLARGFDESHADGLVLFNRFYQPDLDIENLEISPNILLSTPMAMRLPLTWIGILHGHLHASLAATSGIHRATDAIKMLMVGADVTMVCSALLRHGIEHLRTLELDMNRWLEEHEYESVRQLKGSLSQQHCPNPGAFERALYVKGLSSFTPA